MMKQGTQTLDNVAFQLQRQFEANRASHAYVVVAGKERLDVILKQMSAVVVCPKHGCMDCVDCNSAMKSTHHNVFVYPPVDEGGRALKVDDIASLVREASMLSYDGNSRAFLLNATNYSADNFSWQAKLLKMLEEPPANVYIFIGVTSIGDLTETVISRSIVLYANPVSAEQIADSLQEEGFQTSACRICALACGNDPVVARNYIVSDLANNAFEVATDVLTKMTSTANSIGFASNMIAFCTDSEKATLLFRTMQNCMRERILYENAPQLLLLKDQTQLLEAIKRNYSLDASVIAIQIIEEAIARLKLKSAISLVIDELLLKLLEVRYIYA